VNRLHTPAIIASAATIALHLLLASGCGTSRALEWQWAISAGGNDLTSGQAICAAGDGDIYIAGNTNDAVSFGGTRVRSYGGFTSFILRYSDGSPDDPDLVAIFGGSPGVGGSASPYGIAVDGNENVYVAGSFRDSVTFRGADSGIASGVVIATTDMYHSSFVAKYERGGRAAWALPIIGPESESVRRVAVSRKGECYFALQGKGTLRIGDTTLQLPQRRALLVCLGSDGSRRWIRMLEGEKPSFSIYVAVDNDDNPVIWWGYEVKPPSREGSAYHALLLESYTPGGERRWTSPVGWAENVATGRIYFDRDAMLLEGVYVPDTTMDLARQSPISSNALSRFDRDGRLQWCTSVGMPYEYFHGGGVDSDGNYYYVASYHDNPRLDGSVPDSIAKSFPSKTAGARDVIVICRDARTGEFRWTKSTGGPGDEPVLDATVDQEGEIYLTGWFTNRARFGPFELKVVQQSDYFLTKLGREK